MSFGKHCDRLVLGLFTIMIVSILLVAIYAVVGAIYKPLVESPFVIIAVVGILSIGYVVGYIEEYLL